jgi:2'-5' RNA ligase
MAESALAVGVPKAEPYVGTLRQRFDPSAKLGMPAHITVLYPFIPPERIADSVVRKLRDILASVAAFEFRLIRIARFPTALYLAPEPAQPFVRLTEAVVRAFPECPPYGGQHDSIVPHLTVAQAGTAEHDVAETELVAALPPRVGIEAFCNEVVLIENSSGRWEPMHSFRLAR